jgi:hypothetical protein
MPHLLPNLKAKTPVATPSKPQHPDDRYPRDAPVYLLDELAARKLRDLLMAERRARQGDPCDLPGARRWPGPPRTPPRSSFL